MSRINIVISLVMLVEYDFFMTSGVGHTRLLTAYKHVSCYLFSYKYILEINLTEREYENSMNTAPLNYKASKTCSPIALMSSGRIGESDS